MAALAWLVVLGVLWLIAAVTAVIAWVSTHLVLIVVIVVGLVLAGGGAAAGCAGLHCGGCRG